jgi:hypothetical protein
MAVKKRGRPKKEKDRLEPWQFARFAKVSAFYDQARKRGEKHSAAVRSVVGALKTDKPSRFISESVVRKILAKHRSKGAQSIPMFEELPSGNPGRLHNLLAMVPGSLGQRFRLSTDDHPLVKPLAIRVGPRPQYARHNTRKDKKSSIS